MSLKEDDPLLNQLPGKAPLDEDGFLVSFDVDGNENEQQEMQKFLEKFGFVCVRNVLSEKQTDASMNEFFSKFDKNDPKSIEAFYDRQQFKSMGLIGLVSDIDSIRQMENRQNPKVYKAYSRVLQKKELIVDIGRMGALRPTVDLESGKVKKEWKTLDQWLHLDCHPITGRVAVASFGNAHLPHDFDKQWLPQGFLTLTDAREQDGGFHCVPGSHKIVKEWAKRYHNESRGSSIQVPKDDALRNHVQNIPLRKGCLFVWSAFVIHGNRPNHSERYRAVQYIRMFPVGLNFQPLWPKKEFPQSVKYSALGRRLFGFCKWTPSFDPFDVDAVDNEPDSDNTSNNNDDNEQQQDGWLQTIAKYLS